MKLLLLIVKNLLRNKVRTILTCLATMVLVFVITMIWTVVYFLDDLTKQKTENLQAIVTEKWQMAGRMPVSYAQPLSEGAASKTGDIRPKDSMIWQFYFGTLDPEKKTRESMVFFVATDPHKIRTMIDELKGLDPQLVEKLLARKNGALVGPKRLGTIQKKVGETIKVTGLDNYKGLDLELAIVGELPTGQYEDAAIMNQDYLSDSIDANAGPGGTRRSLDLKRVDFVWLRVGNPEEFTQIGRQIETSPLFRDPAVKFETFGAMVSSFLDAYTGFIWFIKWILVPGSMVSMTMVIANAISLSVRERRKEIAVLKVLGFGPGIILLLVLGEAVLVGTSSGLLTSGIAYEGFNILFGGIRFPGNPPYPVPLDALWWGPVVGSVTAILGSLLPAWNARTVNVAEVFAKIA
jgi:putative ABC transport system permease protein